MVAIAQQPQSKTEMPQTAFIALGANLDDPALTVRAAMAALDRQPGIQVIARSSLYRTAPVGLAGQPDFINAVVQVRTDLEPEALLAALLHVEAEFGRVRRERNGPRTLDLDLLLYGNQVQHSDTLTLPHPRLHLRAFVLHPLAEIAPELCLPGRGCVAAWLPAVANQTIQRVPDDLRPATRCVS